ncbi:MAG: heavy metal translocating P-type ATPase [Dehalococcoidia bacterium]
MTWLFRLVRLYPAPAAIVALIVVAAALHFASHHELSRWPAGLAIAIGAVPLVRDNVNSVRRGRYALDYIAFLAIGLSLVTANELVGAVIALMVVGGGAIEDYGVRRARRSLRLLEDRIPREALLLEPDGSTREVPIDDVAVGSLVVVRHGEVLPLDGELVTGEAIVDESSLTGEPFLIDKAPGDLVRSGTVNLGQSLTVRSSRPASESTYRRILKLVEEAQHQTTPMVRLADRYSVVFTILTIALAAGAWLVSDSLDRALAVLVVATPCPLILAPPIALMGGVNRAAREKVIVKRFAALEVLSRLDALIFDKTGTLTMGRPELAAVEIAPDAALSEDEAVGMAAAIERHSLHSIAKAIVEAAKARGVEQPAAHGVREVIGEGIEAQIDDRLVRLGRASASQAGITVGMTIDEAPAAVFLLEDRLKPNGEAVLQRLAGLGIDLTIATGDRRAPAERAAARLGTPIAIEAECTPEAKTVIIRRRQQAGETVGMVGDGINDAPALAQADVGLVFTHEEQTAASEAADVVLLAGDLESVWTAVSIARQSVGVARQAILIGMTLSGVAMLLAAAGLVLPLAGAFLQEAIDVTVILYALRATVGSAPPRAEPALAPG